MTKEPQKAQKTSDVETLSRDEQLEEISAELENIRKELHKLMHLSSLVAQKAGNPAEKAERPAGTYVLTTPRWNGRTLDPAGKKITFETGEAPQSARLVKE